MAINSRREFLQSATRLVSGSVVGSLFVPTSIECMLGELGVGDPGCSRDDELLGQLPFLGEATPEFGKATGAGLGGRLIYDLARVDRDKMVTPNDSFYIRTAAPDGVDFESKAPWKIKLSGMVEKPASLDVAGIVEASQPLGSYVMECSGNGPHRAFGLLSAARWSGVSLQSVIEKAGAKPDATQVIVVGDNNHSVKGSDRNENKSWILPLDSLAKVKPFLATYMNGERLPRNHGYPVRMIVPGWYGCSCIKWVHELRLVGRDEPATPHMQLYAGRTHQPGMPDLARDFLPAGMNLAAMPVRIEKRRGEQGLYYRLLGILWGGQQTTDRLAIRFGAEQDYVPVESYEHKTNATWTLWTHTWKPTSKGTKRIQLRVEDPAIPTNRLDRGYYARSVLIEEV